MNGTEVIPFDFEGKQYQVRVISDGVTIYVRAFADNKPANGYEYRVNIMTSFDLKRAMGLDAIKDLVVSAMDDIRLKRWEHLLEAIKDAEGTRK